MFRPTPTGAVRGRRVLVVEDGPTLTHGGMSYGAGYVAATRGGAAAIVDPRDSATPGVREIFARYPHIGAVLPAVGYDADQLRGLRETINRAAAGLAKTIRSSASETTTASGRNSISPRYRASASRSACSARFAAVLSKR